MLKEGEWYEIEMKELKRKGKNKEKTDLAQSRRSDKEDLPQKKDEENKKHDIPPKKDDKEKDKEKEISAGGPSKKLVFGNCLDDSEEETDANVEGNVIKISYQIHLGLQSFQVSSFFPALWITLTHI